MAVVGHAYVVVRAITDKVEQDIRRGFSGASSSAQMAGRDMGNSLIRGLSGPLKRRNVFLDLRDKLRALYPEAEQAKNSFRRLVRVGYVVTAAFGAIAGSLGALVGGLGALVGVAGAALTNLVALGSAAITLGVGVKIATFALKGISQAVGQATRANGGYSKSLKQIKFDLEEAALSVTRAELNLERAREGLARVADLAPNNRLRREAELAVREAELALRRAKDAEKNPDNGGGTDPYAGLTPAQKQFAEFLAGLKPKFDALREAAAKGFLPLLEEQIKRLLNAGLFEILERRFYDIGRGAGKAVENFTDIFLAGDNLKDFDTVLFNIARNLPKFGDIFGQLFDSLLSSLVAADPVTRKFIGFLEEKTGALSRFLNTKQASGQLEIFFNRAGEIGAKFGKIFGNIFGGLGSLIEANFGPGSGGDSLLQWLDKATSGWRNLDLISQEKYFKGAAENFMAMGDAIGGAFESIIKQGSNPAIKEFWDNLDAGSFAFDQIIRGSVAASPALGDFLRVITEIVALFTESKPVVVFFETITAAARGAREVLETLKPLLDFAAPVFAALTAFTLVFGAFVKFALVIKGFTISILGFLGTLIPAFGVKLPAAMMATTAATKGATVAMSLFNTTNPFGWIMLAVTAITALGVALGSIKGDQMDRAMKGTTTAFKNGADAADVWKASTLAVNDGLKQTIDTFPEMKNQLNLLGRGVRTFATTGLADTFEAMGQSLGNIASTDLPSAQKSFKKFTTEVGLSHREVSIALDEMDDYKKTLIDQADAMGITIRTQEGHIDMLKLTQFALGEGEYAVRQMREAQKALNDAVDAGAKSFIDFIGPINQNKEEIKKWAKVQAKESGDATKTWKDYWDGQSFSMDKYLDDLEKQVEAAKTWRTNIAKLAGELPEEVYKKVVDMGEAGAALVAGLTDGVNDKDEIARFVKSFEDAGFNAGKAVTKGLNRSLPSGVSLRAIMDKKGGGYIDVGNTWAKNRGYSFSSGGFVSGSGTARSDSIPAMLSNGEYVINARATAQNRTLLDAINSNKSVATAPTINMVINPSAEMNEKELAAEISRQLGFKIRRGGV